MSRVSDRGPKRDCGVCYACFCSSALRNLRQEDHDEFKANTWAFQDITFIDKKNPLFSARFYYAEVIPNLCGRRLSKGTNAKK